MSWPKPDLALAGFEFKNPAIFGLIWNSQVQYNPTVKTDWSKLCVCPCVCVQLFEDVVSVLDPEMLDHGRDTSDELTASYSDVSSTDRPAVHDERLTPDPEPEQAAEQWETYLATGTAAHPSLDPQAELWGPLLAGLPSWQLASWRNLA